MERTNKDFITPEEQKQFVAEWNESRDALLILRKATLNDIEKHSINAVLSNGNELMTKLGGVATKPGQRKAPAFAPVAPEKPMTKTEAKKVLSEHNATTEEHEENVSALNEAQEKLQEAQAAVDAAQEKHNETATKLEELTPKVEAAKSIVK